MAYHLLQDYKMANQLLEGFKMTQTVSVIPYQILWFSRNTVEMMFAKIPIDPSELKLSDGNNLSDQLLTK